MLAHRSRLNPQIISTRKLRGPSALAMADVTLQDVPYLSPIIREVEQEHSEREDLETIAIRKRPQASKQ